MTGEGWRGRTQRASLPRGGPRGGAGRDAAGRFRGVRTLGLAAAFGALAALLAGAAAADWQPVDAGRGPVAVQLPPGPAPAGGYPLVVLLHGFGASGAIEELYLGLAPRLAASGFLYALPDGTENPNGNRFWNATDACCDHFGSGVDDVSYLLGLVGAIDAAWGVDPRRVAFVGHSNGGFMAYRMGCSAAEQTAALVALAGATYLESADCAPSRPVRVLHVHGTADERIDYEGGVLLMDPYPGAATSAATWAGYDGCVAPAATGSPFDADDSLPGAETEVATYAVGCRAADVELWSIVGGAHLPEINATFRQRLVAWLERATTTLLEDGFESGDARAWSTPAAAP